MFEHRSSRNSCHDQEHVHSCELVPRGHGCPSHLSVSDPRNLHLVNKEGATLRFTPQALPGLSFLASILMNCSNYNTHNKNTQWQADEGAQGARNHFLKQKEGHIGARPFKLAAEAELPNV